MACCLQAEALSTLLSHAAAGACLSSMFGGNAYILAASTLIVPTVLLPSVEALAALGAIGVMAAVTVGCVVSASLVATHAGEGAGGLHGNAWLRGMFGGNVYTMAASALIVPTVLLPNVEALAALGAIGVMAAVTVGCVVSDRTLEGGEWGCPLQEFAWMPCLQSGGACAARTYCAVAHCGDASGTGRYRRHSQLRG